MTPIAHKAPLKAGPLPAPSSKSRWVAALGARPNARLRLFCFPYAGGDSLTIYRKWLQLLPPTIEVCPVQIPGRGIRVSEPPFTDLNSIVKAIDEALHPLFNKPFAFFGHSMGALISFELARLLRRQRGIEPVHLFVSGTGAPQVPDPDPPIYNLPEADFIQELKRMNGTPKEAWENPELIQLMLPILKADFQVCETHAYVEAPPLDCPLTAFGGLEDRTTRDELEAWRQQTSKRFSLHMFPGDHFFPRVHQETLVKIILTQISETIPGLRYAR